MAAGALAAAGTGGARAASSAEGISAAARALYRRAMVFDANMSPPLSDKFPYPKEDLDAVRAAGITAVKTTLGGINSNFEDTIGEISICQRAIETYPDVFMQVRQIADFATAKRTKRLGILFSFESVEMLQGRLDLIRLFRDLGVRVMQLSYNQASPFGSGVLAKPPSGLTELGRKAVAEMNGAGIALDLSHADPATTMDAIKASTKPVLITHAGCTAVYDHPRNKTDEILKAVAEKGGVVGIYDLPYLTASPKQPALDDYMAHMTHALSVCGEDHVGIGSDSGLTPFDTSPEGMKTFEASVEARRKAGVSAPGEDRPTYVIGLNITRRSEVIADALLKRGFPARVAEKVIGINFVNVLGKIWA